MTKPKSELAKNPAILDLQRLAMEFRDAVNVQLHKHNPHLTQKEINPTLRIYVKEFIKVAAADMRIDVVKYAKKHGHEFGLYYG